MQTSSIPILKGDKTDLFTDYRDALLVNMYGIPKSILGATGYIQSYPGLVLFAEGVGIDRGSVYNERMESHFRLSGEELINVDTIGNTSSLGEIVGSKQAAFPYSFNTQCIIADGNMFLYDGSTLSQVTDSDLGSPIDGVWIDGYYFMTDGEYLFHTDITDETSIDPLKFSTAEFMPDPSLGVAKTQDNKVMIFGRYTLEYFVNTASENFAFSRVETRAQKIGIVATHAKTECGGKWYITGGRKGDGIGVHLITLGQSQKISSREVDKILGEYSEPDLSDMRMESRNDDGVEIVIVHLPNETLCFNVTLAETYGYDYSWSILKTGTGAGVYRGINGVFDPRIGKWIYGDRLNGNIGELKTEIASQYDDKVEFIFYSPLVKLETMSVDELDVETIPGRNSVDDASVSVSLTYNGITYGKEWFETYGEPLSYGKRFIVRRLGYIDDMVGLKFRSVTTSRLSFANMRIKYGN